MLPMAKKDISPDGSTMETEDTPHTLKYYMHSDIKPDLHILFLDALRFISWHNKSVIIGAEQCSKSDVR